MPSPLHARGRALSACVLAVAAAAVAGCTTTGAASSGSIAGHNLKIYISVPPGQLTAEQKDIVSAEQLALNQIGNRIAGYTIKPVEVNANELSSNARGAIADQTAIAYLGELQPGSSAQTIGITNAQDVLQVSPTDDALELTQSVPEVSNSPGVYYESFSTNGQTFARVVPNDRLEAKALVGEMQSLGVKRLYVGNDRSPYGAVLDGLTGQDARAAGITIASSASGADGVLYAGVSIADATTTFDQAAAANPSVKLFAPSTLAESSFAAGLSSAAQRALYVCSPGFGGSALPPAASQFATAFKAAYGHPPASEAIFGYQAMATVLAAMQKAGHSANSRSTVVHDLFRLKNNDSGWPSSAVGSYSIDKSGDITYGGGAPFVFSRVKNRALVFFKAVQQLG